MDIDDSVSDNLSELEGVSNGENNNEVEGTNDMDVTHQEDTGDSARSPDDPVNPTTESMEEGVTHPEDTGNSDPSPDVTVNPPTNSANEKEEEEEVTHPDEPGDSAHSPDAPANLITDSTEEEVTRQKDISESNHSPDVTVNLTTDSTVVEVTQPEDISESTHSPDVPVNLITDSTEKEVTHQEGAELQEDVEQEGHPESPILSEQQNTIEGKTIDKPLLKDQRNPSEDLPQNEDNIRHKHFNNRPSSKQLFDAYNTSTATSFYSPTRRRKLRKGKQTSWIPNPRIHMKISDERASTRDTWLKTNQTRPKPSVPRPATASSISTNNSLVDLPISAKQVDKYSTNFLRNHFDSSAGKFESPFHVNRVDYSLSETEKIALEKAILSAENFGKSSKKKGGRNQSDFRPILPLDQLRTSLIEYKAKFTPGTNDEKEIYRAPSREFKIRSTRSSNKPSTLETSFISQMYSSTKKALNQTKSVVVKPKPKPIPIKQSITQKKSTNRNIPQLTSIESIRHRLQDEPNLSHQSSIPLSSSRDSQEITEDSKTSSESSFGSEVEGPRQETTTTETLHSYLGIKEGFIREEGNNVNLSFNFFKNRLDPTSVAMFSQSADVNMDGVTIAKTTSRHRESSIVDSQLSRRQSTETLKSQNSSMALRHAQLRIFKTGYVNDKLDTCYSPMYNRVSLGADSPLEIINEENKLKNGGSYRAPNTRKSINHSRCKMREKMYMNKVANDEAKLNSFNCHSYRLPEPPNILTIPPIKFDSTANGEIAPLIRDCLKIEPRLVDYTNGNVIPRKVDFNSKIQRVHDSQNIENKILNEDFKNPSKDNLNVILSLIKENDTRYISRVFDKYLSHIQNQDENLRLITRLSWGDELIQKEVKELRDHTTRKKLRLLWPKDQFKLHVCPQSTSDKKLKDIVKSIQSTTDLTSKSPSRKISNFQDLLCNSNLFQMGKNDDLGSPEEKLHSLTTALADSHTSLVRTKPDTYSSFLDTKESRQTTNLVDIGLSGLVSRSHVESPLVVKTRDSLREIDSPYQDLSASIRVVNFEDMDSAGTNRFSMMSSRSGGSFNRSRLHDELVAVKSFD